MKNIFLTFIVAFLSNTIWENLHAFLYKNYMGEKITEFILLRAAIADAVMIVIITLPFIFLKSLKNLSWIIIFVGFILAVGIELWALSTNRWTYNTSMPIIPFLSIGATPAIQLGFLGYFSFKIQLFLKQFL